jgi:tRNA threonylcarbamoyladenosine biosynthesis protein TsaB
VAAVIVLGIETASLQVGCAIGGAEGVLASFHAAHGRRHAEALAPAIEFISRQSGIGLDEVSVVAVDTGPGLFTGLRVGVATAKALAQALRVPMIGLSSLDLLAHPLRHSERLVVPVMDARRGEVFTASYRRVPGGLQRIDDPQVCSPADLAGKLSAGDDDVLLVGDGAIRYRDVLGQVRHAEIESSVLAHPSAASLVQLAHPRAVREEYVQVSELAVSYLRKPDAEINWERR